MLNLKETLKLFKSSKSIPIENPIEGFDIYSQRQKELKNHDARNISKDAGTSKEETT